MTSHRSATETSERCQLIEQLRSVRTGVDQLRDVLTRRERHEQEIHRCQAQIKLLRCASLHCQGAPDMEAALQCAVTGICNYLNWPVGHVYLPASDDTALHPTPIWHLADEHRFGRMRALTERVSFARGDGFPGRAWAKGEPIWVKDVHQEAAFQRFHLDADLPLRAAIAIPVIYYDRTLAVLEFFAEQAIEPDGTLLDVFAELTTELGALAERLRVEQTLETQAQRYHRTLNKLPAPLLTLDARGTIQFWNEAAHQMFGRRSEDVIGTPLGAMLSERYASLLRRYLRVDRKQRPGQTRIFLGEVATSDGETRPIEAAIHPVSNARTDAFVILVRDMSKRQQIERDLKAKQAHLNQLVSNANFNEQRQREELADSLHEHVAQLLAGVQFQLGSLRGSSSNEQLWEQLGELDKWIRQALQDVRLISYELSPPALHDLGLESAVNWLAERLRDRHGLVVEMHGNDHQVIMPNHVRTVLFHAIRELLTNVASHAQVDRAEVSITREGSQIRIDIRDDGIGFDPADENVSPDQGRRLGLLNINEQVMYLGGRMQMDSKPGAGTRITLIVPVPSAA